MTHPSTPAHVRDNRRRRSPPPHLRHHLAPRRGQDDADGETPSLRRRHPARRRGQGEEGPHADALRLDGDRAQSRHLGRHVRHDLRICRPCLQPSRHARPRGLFRRHLPHADGGRRGRHGDRRGQGHRGAHAQALRSLPAARHTDRHLRQQARPRKPRSLRNPRRDRTEARPRHRAGDLADRTGQELFGHLRPSPQHSAPPGQRGDADAGQRTRGARRIGTFARERARGVDRGGRSRAGGVQTLRPQRLPRRPSDAGLFRLGAQELRRARPDRRARGLWPEPARPGRRHPHGRRHGRRHDRVRLQDPGEHGPEPPRPHRLRARLLGAAVSAG